jgi:hypothetical protein
MNRNWVLTLFFALITGLGICYYYLVIKPYQPQFRWFESYSETSTEPYGTAHLLNILEKSTGKERFHLLNKSVQKQMPCTYNKMLYMFIGNQIFADSSDVVHILKFVKSGNAAFISTALIPEKFLSQLNCPSDLVFEFLKDSVIKTSFVQDSTPVYTVFHYQYLKHKALYSWLCINPDYFTQSMVPAGFNTIGVIDSGKVNLFSYKYGKGMLYFHTNPLMFSNYSLVSASGYNYTSRVFSSLEGYGIFWDQLNRRPPDFFRPETETSPLSYILSQQGLRWAWYLLLIMTILFIIFRSKRMQRIIPPIKPNKNTSREFCLSVAQLYLNSKNHNTIAPEMMKLFTGFVKTKYGIRIKPDNKDSIIEELAVKSGIPHIKISRIFEWHVKVQFGDGSDHIALKEFYDLLEYFYKNCK